jgi:hypothetical protein
MNKKVGDRTYLALKYLYLNAIEVQDEKCIHDLRYSAPLAYAKEFGTIKVTTARRAGHSSAIARFVNEFYDNNWAIISYNQHMSKHNMEYIKEYANPYIKKQTQFRIEYENGKKKGTTIMSSFASFERDLRGIDLNGVLVDCACLLSKTTTEVLYQIGLGCMAKNKYAFFIFVE